ncbi:MAG: ATPase [Candidatus Cloacimonadota bacterium]|nr:MAG: ATPase [Candidatus Cloacimonadota bacterium]PIE78240.1 MAG: ATPase [Candidatus Delongbacteria bacterium]
MKITVLSGKGGTGKTTVSTNLFYNSENSSLFDTDVEEPNAHLFFNLSNSRSIEVEKSYPKIDKEKCTLCGKCSDFCNYNALLTTKRGVLVFEESCHDCGGCKLVCSFNAIDYEKRSIGKIHSCSHKNRNIHYGKLNLGELSGVPIIDSENKMVDKEELSIFDAPPGTSCATFAALEDSDYAIIVTEPTPFGVSDMKMVVEMLQSMKIPFGVVVNKSGLGNNEIYEYCNKSDIEILTEIPYSKDIAQSYAIGAIFSEKLPRYRDLFKTLLKNVVEKIQNEEIDND